MNSPQSLSFAGKKFNSSRLQPLPSAFYQQPTLHVAKALLGSYLVLTGNDQLKIGQITEIEAYPGLDDRASHSHKGLTPRTQPLFGPAGHWYVYLIYGMYYCLNVVTDTPTSGGAVLLRELRPIQGIEGRTDGPGRLCKSLGIDKSFNSQSLLDSSLTIMADPDLKVESRQIQELPRIGVDYAGADKDRLYRFRIAE